MSKNIVIQEGGVGKQLTVDKLETNLVGGGSCLWVPEDGTILGSKYINADGTYNASSDGLYGYSQVTVNGVGKAIGIDSDGDEAYTYRDPITGRLVTKKLPSSIVVAVNPSKITYTDGETIDYTGLVVKAYTKSGAVWTDSAHPNGIIPISELTLSVTQADASKSIDDAYLTPSGTINVGDRHFMGPVLAEHTVIGHDITLDNVWPWEKEMGIHRFFNSVDGGTVIGSFSNLYKSGYAYFIRSSNEGNMDIYCTSYADEHFVLLVDTEEFNVAFGAYAPVECEVPDEAPYCGYPGRFSITAGLYSYTYTYSGKTVHYYIFNKEGLDPTVGYAQDDIVSNANIIAWYLMFGETEYIAGKQRIPVQFNTSNVELQTSFFITLQDNGGFGGAEGGGGAGGND